MNRIAIALLAGAALAACGGGSVMPPPPQKVPGGSTPGATVYDSSTSACAVSYEGAFWYVVPAGTFPPIDVKQTRCGTAGFSSTASAPRPSWSIPKGATQARFVATSFQQAYSIPGMQSIEASGVAAHVPISWMIGNAQYLSSDKLYSSYHSANGDDVEAVGYVPLIDEMTRLFPWYKPLVSVQGAGHERDIAGLLSLGQHAFWGITWNSHGTDGTYDYGAPWGSYCADPSSYKRPDPSGACTLLALEWTARDLTRAYLSGYEDYYSTDPDDLQERAQFSVPAAEAYVDEMVDAYAAAGEGQPIVMMSQQESAEETKPGDAQILNALYGRAKHDGMKTETLAQIAVDGPAFSAAPRAVAFPFIPGGAALPSSIVNGQALYPATIDYHDNVAGMTFLAGHALPTRLFLYSQDPTSAFDVPLVSFPASDFPTISAVAVRKGTLSIELQAPSALHFGMAIWSDPAALRMSGPGTIAAGRAGEVLIVDVKAGPNQFSFACPGCKATTFSYPT
ncbi:MAG: hypothetical protein JO199_13700 [Candidatus Eremiobacteraeota bacterium]|nr:hypothetical protein [Candidatus Eremiobacteraeota bacterium]